MPEVEATQLGLQLQPRPRWGGRRAGAGRKPGRQRAVPHVSRAVFRGARPCLVTLRVRDDVASLRAIRVVRALERAFARGCERTGFRLVHYVILGNHAHLLVEAEGRDALARGMKSLVARFAKAVNRALHRTGSVLRDRYHLRVLSSPRQVRNALAYLLLNARKHLGERAPRRAAIDPASSGRFFDGWIGRRGPPAAERPRELPVARARTWLLRVGWRRHGLIDPAEVPGIRVRRARHRRR